MIFALKYSMFVKAGAISSAPLLFKFVYNGFLSRYSTATSTHFLAKYLINSLGFSNDEAISASAKVRFSANAFKNPDLTVNFLKNTGFDDTQIKFLVSKIPQVLFCDVEKNLKPKLHFLSQLGLADFDLVKVILRDCTLLTRGLDTRIRPVINCLRNVLGSDENVVKVIKKRSWLLSYSGGKTMEANLNLLQTFGCSNDKIKNIVLKDPSFLKRNTKKLEEMLHRVEKEVGVSPESSVFLHIVSVLINLSQENADKKFEIFKSFGWSDDDFLAMLQKLPYCIALSGARIQTALTFLMKEVRYTSANIASFPAILTYSLEKRVIPRYEMWKLANENSLIKNRNGFFTVMTWPESMFLEKYVLPVKAELPDLYDLYIKRIGK